MTHVRRCGELEKKNCLQFDEIVVQYARRTSQRDETRIMGNKAVLMYRSLDKISTEESNSPIWSYSP